MQAIVESCSPPFSEIDSDSSVAAVVRYWILRMLFDLGGIKAFLTAADFSDDSLARALGLSQNWTEKKYCRETASKTLQDMYSKIGGSSTRILVPKALQQNSDILGQTLGFNNAEKRIIEFAVILHTEPLIVVAAELVGAVSPSMLICYLATLLRLPEQEVRSALAIDGALAQTGFVVVDLMPTNHFRMLERLDVLSSGFVATMMTLVASPIELLKTTVLPCSAPQLCLDDFGHLQADLALLIPYLAHCLKTHRTGVNVLIYGDPGTGKSQLTRVVAQRLETALFEISSEEEDGSPTNGSSRLRSFGAAQNVFKGQSNLLLFDEIEDVFSDNLSSPGSGRTHKSWVNKMLEHNPAPTFWLSNSISCLDEAFIRRFDFIIEAKNPPLKQREKIISQLSDGLLSKQIIRKTAENAALTTAVVARVSGVLSAIQSSIDAEQISAGFERMVAATLKAQGHPVLQGTSRDLASPDFDVSLINSDIDLTALLAGINKTREGRLCVYGPPGTGKTAFGRWLAAQMGVPIHVKKASDILSKFVGETEQNIARFFREAEEDGALLMLDEVDSFLQDRRNAQRSWEITNVNEMLTQMESFRGVFIASTNLVESLDQASLRRFDLKTRFDYLQPSQALLLFETLCATLALSPPDERLKTILARMDFLTPGDFAALQRRSQFTPFVSAENLIETLGQEMALKDPGNSASIGFM